jgi:2-methylaconitate cis-trans-isomerase PrpF
MPVTKTEITSVEAKRVSAMGKKMNLRIDNNSTITLVALTEEDTARVDFRYTATYSGVGTIGIEGRITFTGKAKELHDKWSETGNMPDDIASEIHSSIMQNCIPVAVILSREIKLPPPIPIPQIEFGKKDQKKEKRPSGIEVA